MNFIDHIVAAISPKAAYEREVYRQAYELQSDQCQLAGDECIGRKHRSVQSG